MNIRNVLILGLAIWLAIQVTGVFNTFMAFNVTQGLFGSAVVAAGFAGLFLYYSIKTKSGDS